MLGHGMLMAAGGAGVAARTISPTVTKLDGDIWSSAASKATASVSAEAGSLLVVFVAQENTTANSNPAVTSVAATGLTFSRVASIIGTGSGGIANAHSVEAWAASVPAAFSGNLNISTNVSVDDAIYTVAKVTNHTTENYASFSAPSDSIIISAPIYSMAIGMAAAPVSTNPGSFTNFSTLDAQNNSGAAKWEYGTVSYMTTGAAEISQQTVSAAYANSQLSLIIVIPGK